MRKNFGAQSWLYPMPVLLVGTYDEAGKADLMNAAWGGIYETNQVVLSLSHSHKTTKNIQATGAFTVSIADAKHVTEADYVGIVSANTTPDKLEKAGLHAEASTFVKAPLFREFPMTLECKLVKFNEDGNVIGEIVNVSADDSILDADGKIDPDKLEPITFDSVHHTYRKLGEVVGAAFSDGKKLQ